MFRINYPKIFFKNVFNNKCKNIKLNFFRFFYLNNNFKFGFYVNISKKISKIKSTKHFINRIINNYLFFTKKNLPKVNVAIFLNNIEFNNLNKTSKKNKIYEEIDIFLNKIII